MELSFVTTHQIVPIPGTTNRFQVTVYQTPRTGGETLTPAEAAAELGCSRRTVQYMIERGDLKAHRPALLRYAIYRRDLDAYKRAHGMS